MIEKHRHWSMHRQYLTTGASDTEEAVHRVVGVYSSHPSGPLSLWARLKDPKPEDFRMLDTDRVTIRTPAMRGSVYMVHRSQAADVRAACLPSANDPCWEARYSQTGRDIPPEKYPDWTREILVTAQKPYTAAELKKLTEVPGEKLKFVLNRMAFETRLLRIGADSLRSNIIKYVAAEAWLGHSFDLPDAARAQARLARWYLHSFGPARMEDFRWWAGITVTEARAAFDSMTVVETEPNYFLPEELEREYAGFEGMTNDQPVLLPQWDSYTMGYAPDGRMRILEKDHLPRLYGKLGATGGNALGAILTNGRAIGVWTSRMKGKKMEVSIDWLDDPGAKEQKKIRDQFGEMCRFLELSGAVFS